MSSQPVALDFTQAQHLDAPITLDFTQAQTPEAPKGAFDKIGESLSKPSPATAFIGDTADRTIAGAFKGAAETVHGIGKFLGMTGAEPESLKPQGGAEHIGAAMETIGEFMSGDEALKALSMGEKLKLVTGISGALEKSPILAKIVASLGTGARAGTVNAVQGIAKTGSGENVGTDATVGAVVGTAGEGVSQAIKGIEKSAQAEPNIAELGDKVLKKYAAKLGGTAEPATSLGDASDKIKALAQQQVFKALDETSQGEFSTLQQTIKKSSDIAKRTGSYSEQIDAEARIGEAENRIQKLIGMTEGKVSPETFQAARAGWRDAATLSKIDRAVDAAFSEPEDVKNLMGDTRVLKANIGKRLNTMLNRVPVEEIDRTLGPGGAKNLFTIARESSSPIIDAMAENSTFGNVARSAQDARRLVVHALIANPKAGKLFLDAVRIGASPKVVVPALMSVIRPEQQE